MFDTNYQKCDKLFFHDRFMEKTVLRIIPYWIVPNHFTLIRFLTTPIVGLLMYYQHHSIALLAFLLVAFTDTIDGSLARTRDQITNWGKVYDPLADKVLISCAVFVIVLKYIGVWTAGIIVGLELAIITVAWFRKKRGAEIQANVWGKIKMGLQVLGVVILLLFLVFNVSQFLPFASATLYLAIAFAVVSLLSYGI